MNRQFFANLHACMSMLFLDRQLILINILCIHAALNAVSLLNTVFITNLHDVWNLDTIFIETKRDT